MVFSQLNLMDFVRNVYQKQALCNWVSIILLTIAPGLLFSQPAPSKRNSVNNQTTDSILLSGIKFRSIGPYRGGRASGIVGDASNKNVYYFGATGGGVWKTQDGGNNWKNISDKFFGGSIGSIAIAPSDNRIIYVGTGENTLRGNVSEGNGMWKSTDGGKTWKNIGLSDSRHITKILIHPQNPNLVYAACIGHLFGSNEERGVFRSKDGGISWQKILYVSNQAGAVDMAMDAMNADIIYASTWKVIRTPYSMESGGQGSGLWKTTDGGNNWLNISRNKGLPEKDTLGIIGITVCPSNTDHLYAIVEAKSGGLFSSMDAGKTWTKVNAESKIRQRAWYFSKIEVDPNNENIVWVCNVELHKSTDGGKSFSTINTPHGDHHGIWIDPKDGNRLAIADDGGGVISLDAGKSWSTYYNQPTGQFYRVTTDNHFPYRIYGAQQDNTTIRILSRTYDGNINQSHWSSTAGFESGWLAPDPTDDEIVYGGNYCGYISRLDHRTGENRVVSVWPESSIGWGADSLKYRFQWNFPLFFSPHNPKKLYAAGNMLFVTENEGQSWKAISPDLTRNDKTRQAPSGGIITKDNTSVEYYCTIFAAAESPIEKDLIWCASDDGLVHITRDGGATWKNVTPTGLPDWMLYNSLEINPHKPGSIYLAGTRYKTDDNSQYILYTEDYGSTWKRLSAVNKNPYEFIRVVRADKKVKGLIYAGTERGLHFSTDNGQTWRSLQQNLPEVPITDLTIKNNDLIIATQGRAFWILDDLGMLQEFAENSNQISSAIFHLYQPGQAYRMRGYQHSGSGSGSNPPSGAVFNFYLKEINDSISVTAVIRNTKGQQVEKFSTKADKKLKENELTVEKGINTFVWDLRYDRAETIDGMILWNGVPSGPMVAPGNYSITLKIGADSVVKNFSVTADPNYKISQSDYEAQTEFLLKVRDKFSETQNGIKKIREITATINNLIEKLGPECPTEIKEGGGEITKKLKSIEEALYQTKAQSGQDVLNYPVKLNDKLAGIYNAAAAGQVAPSTQVKDAYDFVAGLIDIQLNQLKGIIDTDLKKFNQLAKEKDIPVIIIK